MNTLPVLALSALLAAALTSGCGPASPEDRFVADVRDTDGVQTQATDGHLLLLGRDACLKIGNTGQTRDRVVAGVPAEAAQLRAASVSEADARAIVDAAYAHLCPNKTFELKTEVTPEQRFLAYLRTNTGSTLVSVADDELLRRGRVLCALIGTVGLTRDQLEQQTVTGNALRPDTARAILVAAETELCPGNTYSSAPAPALEPAGPLTTFGEGTWEVGVDIEAGKYKTTGSSRCYWARLDGEGTDIIDNNIGAGPQTVTVKTGELFESKQCGTWTKPS